MSQIQWLAGQAEAFRENVVLVNVSVDLPYALKRYKEEKGIENAEFLSDYRDEEFGENWGVLLKEIQLLARGLFIVDEDWTLRYSQICHDDLFQESLDYEDIEKAFNELKLYK